MDLEAATVSQMIDTLLNANHWASGSFVVLQHFKTYWIWKQSPTKGTWSHKTSGDIDIFLTNLPEILNSFRMEYMLFDLDAW